MVPPRVTATSPLDKDLVDGRALLGYRVPCIVASPWTKGDPHHPAVDHRLYDHASILKLITSTFGLRPLTVRDASRSPKDPANLASLLRRGTGDASVPASIPALLAPPLVNPCGPTNPMSVDDTWGALRASGLLKGWPV